MTDLREHLRSALADEPPSTIDPYAAIAAGRHRRAIRHRWLAGAVAAALVGFVGVSAFTLRPNDGTSPAPGIATPDAPKLDWTTTAPTAASGFDLDVSGTLAYLDGAAERIQDQLGMAAVASARPYDLDTELGSVQLAYRTADGSEVHAVIEGSYTASAAASCVRNPTVPELPRTWPSPTSGDRPRGSEMCTPGPVVATTEARDGRIDRTVAEDVVPLYRGVASVTITSDATAPAPATVAAVAEVVDELRRLAAFTYQNDTPQEQEPQTIDVKWNRVEPAESGAGVLDLDRTLRRLGPDASKKIQEMLSLPATGKAKPFEVPRDTGAVQLVYRTADDVIVQVLVQGALRHPTEKLGKCTWPPPDPLSSWPSEVTGKWNPAPEPRCYESPTVNVTDVGDGRVARSVAEWGDSLGHVSVMIVSDASKPAPASLDAVKSVLWIFDKGVNERF